MGIDRKPWLRPQRTSVAHRDAMSRGRDKSGPYGYIIRRRTMATDVILPALGMSQDTGKILQWLKAEGEQVAKGEPLAEIETDKATVEIEAPADGVLAQVAASAGDDVPVGQVIATILAPGEVSLGDVANAPGRGEGEQKRSGEISGRGEGEQKRSGEISGRSDEGGPGRDGGGPGRAQGIAPTM